MMNNNDSKDAQTQKPMPKPTNEIDLQSLTTFPQISSDYMSDRIRNKFREFDFVRDEKGNISVDEQGNARVKIVKDLWATMELFTQDLRLGNLNKEEANVVRYQIDLCSDILIALPDTFSEPALISLERAINVTETSQSKGGFLRRMFNTFFSHTSTKDEQPTKRSFFGLGKKNKME